MTTWCWGPPRFFFGMIAQLKAIVPGARPIPARRQRILYPWPADDQEMIKMCGLRPTCPLNLEGPLTNECGGLVPPSSASTIAMSSVTRCDMPHATRRYLIQWWCLPRRDRVHTETPSPAGANEKIDRIPPIAPAALAKSNSTVMDWAGAFACSLRLGDPAISTGMMTTL
jgi:hypothetical protein